MSKYKRPNFDADWWEKVRNYLKENPDEGFEEHEVKQFIKNTVNKHMETSQESISKEDLQQMRKKMEELLDEEGV